MKNRQTILLSISVISIISLLLYGFSPESSITELPDDENISFNKKYSITSIQIPTNILFAGEKVPVGNFDTYESIDREMLVNTYWQSQTLLFLKKAHRYFPIIEPILKEHGVPDDFKYLAVAESGLSNVVSPAKASGFWQFLKGTAQDYKLEVNSEVDERYHLEKATHAAAKFLKESYNKFGSWSMAAASYNMGRRNVSKQMARQKSNNYYDLILGEETGRYVYRLIALKLILESPAKFGFNVKNSEKYQEIDYKTVVVDSAIQSIPDFAHKMGVNYKLLKELNPWLRDNKLTNKYRKSYTIKIASTKQRTVELNTKFYPTE